MNIQAIGRSPFQPVNSIQPLPGRENESAERLPDNEAEETKSAPLAPLPEGVGGKIDILA
jgi:hypothetical protein